MTHWIKVFGILALCLVLAALTGWQGYVMGSDDMEAEKKKEREASKERFANTLQMAYAFNDERDALLFVVEKAVTARGLEQLDPARDGLVLVNNVLSIEDGLEPHFEIPITFDGDEMQLGRPINRSGCTSILEWDTDIRVCVPSEEIN